jgi:hypothetical protein
VLLGGSPCATPRPDDELRLIGSYPRQLALLFPGVTS